VKFAGEVLPRPGHSKKNFKGQFDWSALADHFRTFLLMPDGPESIFRSLQSQGWVPPGRNTASRWEFGLLFRLCS
jgi:hypothetical protein